VVRGTAAIQRVLELTRVEELLVLVDDPDDLGAATRHELTCRGARGDRQPRCCSVARAAGPLAGGSDSERHQASDVIAVLS
jgi:hypothetical protein